MSQLTAEVQPIIVMGGTIHLTAKRSDGSTVDITLTEGRDRGYACRSVTTADGHLASASIRSWPLDGDEPELALQAREAIRIARNGLSGAFAG